MFSKYVCAGDQVSIEENGITYVVTLHIDDDCSPMDYDCYTLADIENWKNNKWFYGYLSVDVMVDGIIRDDNAAGLGGIECNLGDNEYLNDYALDLVNEARKAIKSHINKLIERLQALS